MTNNSQNVINCIKRRKSNLIKIFDSKCCICGFDKFQEALEFHHVNPAEKEFSIGASNAITKCVLLCSNCHRGIHAGYYQVPENWRELYNEEIAQQLLDDLEKTKTKTLHYCQRCGTQISHKAIYCENCYSIIQRKVDRPSREDLKNQIRELPFTQIGKKFGVSDNAIRKWCKLYNLPSTKGSLKAQLPTESVLVFPIKLCPFSLQRMA